jgi:hypothetical protein
VKRLEALEAVKDEVFAVFPKVSERTDSTWSHAVGLEVRGVAGVQAEVLVFGSRTPDGVTVHVRIAGVATESVPLWKGGSSE